MDLHAVDTEDRPQSFDARRPQASGQAEALFVLIITSLQIVQLKSVHLNSSITCLIRHHHCTGWHHYISSFCIEQVQVAVTLHECQRCTSSPTLTSLTFDDGSAARCI